jgi:hypothetical protein
MVGILLMDFYGGYYIKQQKWTLCYQLTRPVDRITLKNHIDWFVREEWAGTECEFYADRKTPDSKGKVKFWRGDL